jgi:hypothetical protein
VHFPKTLHPEMQGLKMLTGLYFKVNTKGTPRDLSSSYLFELVLRPSGPAHGPGLSEKSLYTALCISETELFPLKLSTVVSTTSITFKAMKGAVNRVDHAESQKSDLEFSSNKIRDDLIFPRYLVETCSSRSQDYSVQAEGERLSNTFRTGSHWTLKKLPNHLGPGSIRNERAANRMTNLLGSISTFVA